MRSKLLVWGYLVVLSLGTMLSLYMPKTEAASKESIVIPGEAIRLRILANSDFEKDQAIKRKVRDAVNAQITLWVQDLTSMQEAKQVMNEKLPEIQAIAEEVVREQGSDQSVKVEFGKVQFPTKLYGQFLYPAGEYQAILITLGSGEGANWWCVLYPPLCFLDFSNGTAVSEGFEEHKVKAETVEGHEESVEKVAVETSSDENVVETQPKETVKQPDTAKKESSAHKQSEVNNVSKEDKQKWKTVEKDDTMKADVINKKQVIADEPIVEKRVKKQTKKAPVYTAEDEEPVKVKFFAVEMWEKMFD
ncbi:stage II sporulation protein R [Neobacillus jeddahensis]|uniref:stage II sporulation protein R n=1 Tax=Neobacillus jeddahensis TaxID=1461580 RepID=UPI0005908CD8|nr:stage II sporulation protein R [Neobacillus jeddahensis]